MEILILTATKQVSDAKEFVDSIEVLVPKEQRNALNVKKLSRKRVSLKKVESPKLRRGSFLQRTGL